MTNEAEIRARHKRDSEQRRVLKEYGSVYEPESQSERGRAALLTLLDERDEDNNQLRADLEAANKRIAESADSCACTHDGRGNLIAECQEHERIRTQLQAARAALKAIARGGLLSDQTLQQVALDALEDGDA